MDMVNVLEYLEKHFSWRVVAMILVLAVGFFIGYYFCSAQRDKQEAILINQHTKDIKAYCDSANSLKVQNQSILTRFEFILRDKQRTIDSLNNIIKSQENEGDK